MTVSEMVSSSEEITAYWLTTRTPKPLAILPRLLDSVRRVNPVTGPVEIGLEIGPTRNEISEPI